MNIQLIFSGRDKKVLYALPAVLWLSGCLYAVLTMLEALPPGISTKSPVSIQNLAIMTLCMLLVYPIYRIGYLVIRRRFPEWPPIKMIATMSIVCVALGATALVATLLSIDLGEIKGNFKWYMLNLLVGLLLMPAFFFLVRGSTIVLEQISGATALGAAKPLLRKLGPDAGQKLVRMQSADHYVEVHTEIGAKLLLMRLSDAVDMLTGFNGAQVHRSHWVNLGEVSGVKKQNRKVWLRMSDGAEVPVSRSFRPHLREMGLI